VGALAPTAERAQRTDITSREGGATGTGGTRHGVAFTFPNEHQAGDLRFYLLPELGDRNHAASAKWTVREEVDPRTGARNEVLADSATGQQLTPQQLDRRLFENPARTPIVTAKDLLANSRATVNPSTNTPAVEFEFSAAGSQALEKATRTHIGKSLAIFLDRRLLTAPTINAAIPARASSKATSRWRAPGSSRTASTPADSAQGFRPDERRRRGLSSCRPEHGHAVRSRLASLQQSHQQQNKALAKLAALVEAFRGRPEPKNAALVQH